jgi:membrane associated rhomboid family serine protease
MNQFETNTKLVFGYPILLIIFIWSIQLLDYSTSFEFFQLGILPRNWMGLFGILFSPFIHSAEDIKHILSNSVPIFVLLASLIYFYKEIATKVFLIVWIGGGFLTWIYARESYHIGMSGVIYGLNGFLFTSGAIRKYKPLMGLSLFVVFLYGSLIWGIFPLEAKVSWEGHLSGLILGVLAAIIYRREGPQQPKFRYEIEKEMGIEPVDYEQLWREAQMEHELQDQSGVTPMSFETPYTFTYHVVPNKEKEGNKNPPPLNDEGFKNKTE